MIVDYHMHLRSSASDDLEATDHSLEAVERYVEAAASAGVDEICFTEHVYYFTLTRPLWHIDYEVEHCVCEIELYVSAVLQAKERGLPVKLGLEVDFVLGRERETSALLDAYPWDFWLGSIHYVDDLSVDGEPELVDAVGVDEAWCRYFDRLGAAAESGLFDSLSHPDLVKLWGRRPAPEREQTLFETVAARIAGTGTCIEVSTAGLMRPVEEIYPDPRLLAACCALDVPVTMGSDAHGVARVGADLDRAVELMRSAGYETVTVFDNRRGRQVPLG
jgi:histidinol-phosphatase (PHP family)